MNRFEDVLAARSLWAPTVSPSLKRALASAELGTGAVFPTSGSSGDPKFVQLSLPAMLASAQCVNEWLEVSSEDVFALALPDFHVGGFMVGFRAAVARAGLVEIAGKWDALEFVEFLRQSGATLCSLVPAQVVDLVNLGREAPVDLRALVVGGAALEPKVAAAARQLGWPILRSFGMSESSSQVATQPLNEAFLDTLPSCLPHVSFSLGKNERLTISGPSLFDGYWSCSGVDWQFDARDGDCWESSDRVEIESGRLRHLGRVDRVVKILGEQVNVDELSRELAAMVVDEGSLDIEIVDLPDERAGVRLVLVGNASAVFLRQLLESLNRGKSGIYRVNDVLPLNEIPRSALGKPMLGELRKLCMFNDK